MTSPDTPPAFIDAVELSRELGVCTRTLGHWVGEGVLPRPWSRLGERKRLWRRDHWQAFLDTGYWPEIAWKRGK